MARVRLTRRAKIWHEAGETLAVSSAEAAFLISVGSAVPCREYPEATAQREAPELPKESEKRAEAKKPTARKSGAKK